MGYVMCVVRGQKEEEKQIRKIRLNMRPTSVFLALVGSQFLPFAILYLVKVDYRFKNVSTTIVQYRNAKGV